MTDSRVERDRLVADAMATIAESAYFRGPRENAATVAGVVVDEVLAALDAVPNPSREKVAEAIQAASEATLLPAFAQHLADAAIAAGAGTGLTPEEADAGLELFDHIDQQELNFLLVPSAARPLRAKLRAIAAQRGGPDG